MRATSHLPHGPALSSRPHNRRADQALVGPPSNRNTQNPNPTASPANVGHGSTRLNPGSEEDDCTMTGSHGLLGPGSWRVKEGPEASPHPQFCLTEENMWPWTSVGAHERNVLPSSRAATPGWFWTLRSLPSSAYMAAPQLTFFLVYLLPLCSPVPNSGAPLRLCQGPAHPRSYPGHLSTPAPPAPLRDLMRSHTTRLLRTFY